RASGLSQPHSGLSDQAAPTKITDAMATDPHACASESEPLGSSRFRVRGFRASYDRSAIRLNPIATQRAAENARITRTSVLQVIGATREAASTPSRANGRAKSVCGSFTKLT